MKKFLEIFFNHIDYTSTRIFINNWKLYIGTIIYILPFLLLFNK